MGMSWGHCQKKHRVGNSKSEMEKGGIQTAQPRLLEDGIREQRTEIQSPARPLALLSRAARGQTQRPTATALLSLPCQVHSHLVAWVSVPGLWILERKPRYNPGGSSTFQARTGSSRVPPRSSARVSAVLLGQGRVWVAAMPLRWEWRGKKLVVGLTVFLIKGLHA